MKLYKLIIFDADGTFRFISREAVYKGWMKIFSYYVIDHQKFFTNQEEFNEWISPDWHIQAHEIGLLPEQLRECNAVFKQEYLKHAYRFEWVAKIFPVLARRSKLAVWTSSDTPSVKQTLGEFDQCISLYMTCHELTKLKPDPEGGRRILDELHISVEDAVFVGDDLVDLQAAQQLGMDMAAVTWGLTSLEDVQMWDKPTYIFTDPVDLFTLA